MTEEILIVDDDEAVAESLAELLVSKGYSARVIPDPSQALALAASPSTALALVDLRMPGIGGIELLQALKSRTPDLPVFIISGYVTVETAILAMKYGATDIFSKPIRTADMLVEIRRVMSERRTPSPHTDDESIKTHDPRMMEAVNLVAKAAPTDAPVLLRGESGTGKELAARMLHRQSRRSANAFVAINCAAISDELLESEMFGHERGAFTDARERKRGILEAANGGTIFLDEIGEMSLRIQAKMLRVLQDGRFTRVGGVEPILSDCRVVSATNRDLYAAIRQGQFREDLYYRIAVVDIPMPPLRDRPGDILPLANDFLRQFAERYGKRELSFSEDVLSIMRAHSWPGNVRELKNFVERAVIFAEGKNIELDNVSPQYRTIRRSNCEDFHDRLIASAQDAIVEALSRVGGSKTKAAQLLHIDRKTLYNHLKKASLG
jgi:DNA-binding NtrC family response regulator